MISAGYDAVNTLNFGMLIGRTGQPMTDTPNTDSGYFFDRNTDTDLPELPEGRVIGKVANYIARDEHLELHTKIAMLGEGAIALMPRVSGQGQLAGDIWFDVRQVEQNDAKNTDAFVDVSLDVATNGALEIVSASAGFWRPDSKGLDEVHDVLEVFELSELTTHDPGTGRKYQYREAHSILLDPEQCTRVANYILDIVSRSELQP